MKGRKKESNLTSLSFHKPGIQKDSRRSLPQRSRIRNSEQTTITVTHHTIKSQDTVMRCFSFALGVNTTTLIRWKRNKTHFPQEEEEWGTTQHTDAFFTTVHKQTPSHLMTYIIERFLLFWLCLWQLFVLFDVIYIFLRRNTQWFFFPSPWANSVFSDDDSKWQARADLKTKTKARKITLSHQFPHSALLYQGWHFHLFREKQKGLRGHGDDWFIGSHNSHVKLIHILCEAYE